MAKSTATTRSFPNEGGALFELPPLALEVFLHAGRQRRERWNILKVEHQLLAIEDVKALDVRIPHATADLGRLGTHGVGSDSGLSAEDRIQPGLHSLSKLAYAGERLPCLVDTSKQG